MAVQFHHRRLDNGLTIIAEADPTAHSAAAGFFVRTGARDETLEVMGVSHFLEHMMFKGTDDLDADQINQRFDAMGARNNAYTSHELTCFYAQVLPERLGEATDLLARMMRPALRQDDFDVEKGVILEEIAMYQDQPFWVLYEATDERHYAGHPLGYRVLGTPESITALTRDQMRSYFDHRYSADNTTLALAGNIDFDACVQQAQRLCNDWPTTGPMRNNARPRISGDRFELRDDRVSRAYWLAVADAPAVQDDRRYAASIIAQILGGANNSRLHWALIETGIAEEAQAQYDPRDGTGQFLILATGDPANLDQISDIIDQQISVLRDSIAQDDLDRLRAKYATGVTLGGEKPGDRMQRLGRLWTALGEHLPLEEELRRIHAVTVDDLRDTLDAFPLEPRTVGRLVPGDAAS